MTPTRKPLLKPRPTGKFRMQPFQREDLEFLMELDSCANWSELWDGCDEDHHS